MDITLKANVVTNVNRYINMPTTKVVSLPVSLLSPSEMSDKQLTSQVSKIKRKVKSDASKISSTQRAITSQQKVIDKTDDYLKKQNGYSVRKAAYDAVTKQIDTQESKLANAKTTASKKAIQSKINSLKKSQKAAYADLKKVTSSSGYQKQLTAQSKARTKLKQSKSKLTSLKKLKSKDKDAEKKLKAEQTKRKAAEKKKKQKANLKSIKSKIAEHKKQPLVGQTVIYPADLMSSVVYFFGEVQPTETNTSEITSVGVDNSDPRAGKSTRTSKELSGTYYLFGKSFADCDKKFSNLQKLQRIDTEFIMRGFSNWNHVKISSLAKTVSGLPRENLLELSITFTYVKQARILYNKAKKKTKKKGSTKGSKKKGSSKSKYRSHVVKSGETYWGLARKYKTSVATLTKLNGSWKKTMFPGRKLKIPK